jgi:phage internal scaffolding protein
MSLNPAIRPPISQLIHGFIRSGYSFISPISLTFSAVSPYTRQEFKDECDINVLMKRYQSTGELPHLNTSTPQFLDVSSSLVFQESMNYIADAQSMFNELPSAIRDRFYNDPAQFLDFCSNDKNRLELAEMGLLSPEATFAAFNPPPPLSPTTPPPKSSETPPNGDS